MLAHRIRSFLVALTALVVIGIARPAHAVPVAVYVDGFYEGTVDVDIWTWTWLQFWYGVEPWEQDPWVWRTANDPSQGDPVADQAVIHAAGAETLVVAREGEAGEEDAISQIAVPPGTLAALEAQTDEAILEVLPELTALSSLVVANAEPMPICRPGYKAIIKRQMKPPHMIIGVRCVWVGLGDQQ